MDKKTAETIVKFFSIIGIVFSALGVVAGLIILLGGQFLGGMLDMAFGGMSGLLGGAIAITGVIIIILSALFIWIYTKLMKYTNWARILLSVFAVIGFIGGILSLPISIINFLYEGAFIYFFLIDKDVTALYK